MLLASPLTATPVKRNVLPPLLLVLPSPLVAVVVAVAVEVVPVRSLH